MLADHKNNSAAVGPFSTLITPPSAIIELLLMALEGAFLLAWRNLHATLNERYIPHCWSQLLKPYEELGGSGRLSSNS